MSLTKNKIIAIIAVLVIALQVAYIFTVYNDQVKTINDLDTNISKKEQEIKELQRKLQDLPNLEAELEKTKLERNALIAQIPSSYSSAKDFSNIIDIAQANGLNKLTVKSQEANLEQLGDYDIKQKRYTLTYYSSYQQSENFIRNLNRSYQTIQLDKMVLDNQPQVQSDEVLELLYKGDQKDLIRTELTLVMFTNPTRPPKEEIYDSGFSIIKNNIEPFYNYDQLKDGTTQPADSGSPETGTTTGDTVQPDLTRPATSGYGPALFTMNIADILTSGDNLQFSGPGPNGSVYAGMRTSKEAFITFTIREDSYDVVIEDTTGKIAQNNAFVRANDLSMQIYSAISKISADMPTIHVYVNNYTNRNITVRLTGYGTEYVKIYNSLGQQVLPGQTSGKVTLVGR